MPCKCRKRLYPCAKFRYLGIPKRSSEHGILQCCSAAVLRSERGKRLKVGGWRQKEKCQLINDNELVGCISLIGFIG